MPLSDKAQTVSVMTGAGLCVGGVYYAMKFDATTGGAMIAAGLAVLGGKELAGAQGSPPTPQEQPKT